MRGKGRAMKRLGISVLAVVATLSLTAGFALAGMQNAAGEVVKVDPAAKSLVVKIQGKEVAFNVADKAARSLGDLKPGDHVQIMHDETGGKRTAETIEKTPQ